MGDKQWFETWFDTPYYHQLYQHRDEQEAHDFLTRLIAYVALPQAARILDVACGKGRHSRFFASQGYETTGIDLSVCSITEAQQQPMTNLHFAVWDMRQVYRSGYYDMVVNLFSSLGYFQDSADDHSAIQAMAAAIKPDGVVVIDHLNPEWVAKVIKARHIIDRGEIQFHIRKRIEAGVIVKDIEFIANGENHHYQERLRMYKPEEFLDMCAQAGLEIVQTFGSYQLEPFKPAISERQIMVCKRK